MTDLNVDVVLLDAGGVLVVPAHEVICERFGAAGFEVDPTRLFEAHYRGVQAIDLAEAEPEVFDDYHRAYAAHVGVDEASLLAAAEVLQGLWHTSGLWRQALPWAAEGLAAIAATGVPIVIVSNADGTVDQVLAEAGLLQVGPGAGVEVFAIVDSGAVGVAKPDPAIFHHALDLVGATPDRAVHVGDAYQYDVRGARAAGVRPILIDPLGIRADADCERMASLTELVDLLS
ncbi:MAG: hypothetical protein JWO77_1525 [Ilumatobacteraceae bacterium]|nr:hypothetical protein [Ilumatobacteraceae bacterium]